LADERRNCARKQTIGDGEIDSQGGRGSISTGPGRLEEAFSEQFMFLVMVVGPECRVRLSGGCWYWQLSAVASLSYHSIMTAGTWSMRQGPTTSAEEGSEIQDQGGSGGSF